MFSALAGLAARAIPFIARVGGAIGRGISTVFKGARAIAPNIAKGIKTASPSVIKGLKTARRIGANFSDLVGKGLDIGSKVSTGLDIAQQSGLIPRGSAAEDILGRVQGGVGRAISGGKRLRSVTDEGGRAATKAIRTLQTF